MRSQHVAMSWEEFELLPPHPGWKHEYWDGVAHISPAERFAVVELQIHPRPAQSPLKLRAVSEADESALVDAYLDAFRDTVEYCDWEEGDIARSARENVQAFCGGRRRDSLLHCSAIAAEPSTPHEVAGAALLVRTQDGHPMLDTLFVRPHWHRRGLATALVSRCLDGLHQRGDTLLRSRYHLANDASRAWHLKFGFSDAPDLLLAHVYLRCAAQELRRRENLGNLPDDERSLLIAARERWHRCVEDLQRIADEQGWEAVSPTLRIR